MKAVGVVAEYNPFHSGHAWQLTELRRRLGAETPVVCVMSGSWVQRGECAVTDKWTRAEMALRGGADLVLELPVPWAISSAEGFAQGSVLTLLATGVVDKLSFGSESGNAEALKRTAEVLDTEAYRQSLLRELETGISFAEARQRAVEGILGQDAVDLKNPNDNLGMEYLRQAKGRLTVYPLLRQGVSHDSNSCTAYYASASYLRRLFRQGDSERALRWMGAEDVSALKKAGIASMEHIERAMLARLRQMTEEDFTCLPDSGAAEGLCARLARAARQAGSMEEFYALSKTKRYAYARLRRLALWAFLGLRESDRPTAPQYLRVLGFSERGRELLREMKDVAELPVLTKAAHIEAMSPDARSLFQIECKATDLYSLCFNRVKPMGEDFIRTPIYRKEAR